MTTLMTSGGQAATDVARLLPGEVRSVSLREHRDRHGEQAGITAAALVGELTEAGLTGRGGAGFPTARKLSAVLAAGAAPIVVANASEGEPASSKDAMLLWSNPHLVLDGVTTVFRALDARRAVLYVDAHPSVLAAVAGALGERRAAGLRESIEVVTAHDGFLSGQETAVVAALNGRKPLPVFQTERISRRGVDGRPTFLSNAETFAHIALIARYGAPWYTALGTRAAPGTTLVTVHAGDGGRRVLEVEHGSHLADVLPIGSDVAGVLIGGYHGTWVPCAVARSLTLDPVAMRDAGIPLGAGVLAALPADRCPVTETARVMDYLAGHSARQCGPCTNGLPAIAGALAALSSGRATRSTLADLDRWTGLMPGRGACAHPDGSVRMVRSALSTFASEVRHHLAGQCTATNHQPFLPLEAR